MKNAVTSLFYEILWKFSFFFSIVYMYIVQRENTIAT